MLGGSHVGIGFSVVAPVPQSMSMPEISTKTTKQVDCEKGWEGGGVCSGDGSIFL